MAVELVQRKAGYNGCAGCKWMNKKVDPNYFTQYKLYGFCNKHIRWITLLDDPGLPILQCGAIDANRIYKA